MLMKQAAADIAPLTGLNEEEVLRLLEVPPQAEMGDAAFPCFVLTKSLKKHRQSLRPSSQRDCRQQDLKRLPPGRM